MKVIDSGRTLGATIEDRRALEAYRVEERQLAAAAEASMREVSDADDADDADDDEDDERSRSRLTSPDSRPPEDVERLVAGLSAQLEDARDALEIAEVDAFLAVVRWGKARCPNNLHAELRHTHKHT